MKKFFFNDTATTEIYTLSLHDALPIYVSIANVPYVLVVVCATTDEASSTVSVTVNVPPVVCDAPSLSATVAPAKLLGSSSDRKSTRLNSSH